MAILQAGKLNCFNHFRDIAKAPNRTKCRMGIDKVRRENLSENIKTTFDAHSGKFVVPNPFDRFS
jgi:hypothetical protein